MAFFARAAMRSFAFRTAMRSAAPRAFRSMATRSARKASRPDALLYAIGLAGGCFMLGTNIVVEASDGSAPIEGEMQAKLDAAAAEIAKHVKLTNITQQIIWNALRKDIEAILEDDAAANPGVDGFPGNSGGGGFIGPMFVRLAWHCSGTFCKDAKNGGSEGATMRFCPEADHGGNAGLGHARALLEPLYKKYQRFGITYADLYIFSGNVSIEHMGGPDLPFHTGRSDASGAEAPTTNSPHSPDGRLPDADGRGKSPAEHVRDIFYRMGFDDREIVALSGAHGLGHCHTDRSGFWGPWTYAPTTFSNEYFRLLVEEKWSKKLQHKGADWTGPEQFENPNGELMMLPTDVALVEDPKFEKFVVIYQQDEGAFFTDFAAAWTKLTELGCPTLSSDSIVNIERKADGEAVEAALVDVATACTQ